MQVVAVDLAEDEAIINAWFGREITSSVMQLRKAGKLQVGDAVEVFWSEKNSSSSSSASGVSGSVANALTVPEVAEAVKFKLGGAIPFPMARLPSWTEVVASSTFTVREGNEVTVAIARPGVALAEQVVMQDFFSGDGDSSSSSLATLGALMVSVKNCAAKDSVKVSAGCCSADFFFLFSLSLSLSLPPPLRCIFFPFLDFFCFFFF